MKKVRFIYALLAIIFGVSIVVAQNPTPAVTEGWVVADGQVNTVFDDGNHVYVGGNYTQVGKSNTNGLQMDQTSGLPLGKTLKSNGIINTAVADGSGGWFVGGTFTAINGVARQNLAHILPNGDVDPAWNASANNAVWSMVLNGGVLYVGGNFTVVNGDARNRLVSLSAANGSLTTNIPFNLGVNDQINVLKLDGTQLFLGGAFTAFPNPTVIGRSRFAVIDISTNPATLSSLHTGIGVPNFSISSIEVTPFFIFTGGSFTNISGNTNFRNLCRWSRTTSTLDNTYTPSPDNVVTSLLVDPSNTTLWVGGAFNNIGGQPRQRLAYLNSNGTAAAFRCDANGSVRSIKFAGGGNIWVGGDFTTIGANNATAPSQNLSNTYNALMNGTTGVITTTFNHPVLNGYVADISIAGGKVFLAGGFSISHLQNRGRIARFNRSNMELDLSWTGPALNNAVVSVGADDNFVYLGGAFSNVGGIASANRLIRVSKSNGTVDAGWSPNPNAQVNKLLVHNNNVYVGGNFTTISGTSNAYFTRLNTTNGNVTPGFIFLVTASSGSPSVNNIEINPAGDRMLVVGNFNFINGQANAFSALFDIASNGTVTLNPFSTSLNQSAFGAAMEDNAAYVGGTFIQAQGQPRNRAAKYTLGSPIGLDNSWDPDFNNTVLSMAVYDNHLYAGGNFTGINNQASFSRFGRVNKTTGVADFGFTPQFLPSNSQVNSVHTRGLRMYVGGSFENVDNNADFRRLMVYDLPCFTTVINQQPQTQSVCQGGSATLSVSATGAELSYQWRRNSVNIPGANANNLSLNNVQAADAGSYDVVISGPCGTVTSNAAVISLTPATSITSQPTGGTFCQGTATLSFQVTAVGSGLTYQWRKDGTNIPAANAATFTLNNLQPSDAGSFDVLVSGTCGNVTSNAAVVVVTQLPQITQQPSPTLSICQGQPISLTASATGNNLTYQWRRNGVNLAGETSSTLTIGNAPTSASGNYDVIVSNGCGTVTSSISALNVQATTVITTQPLGGFFCEGHGSYSLQVNAEGAALTYQWRKNGVNIPGATSATFTLSNLQPSDDGSYDVVVSGTCGTVTSFSANISVFNNTSITSQPIPVDICEGQSGQLQVSAGGGFNSFQWFLNGNPVGTNSATLSINSASSANAGSYTVTVSGACGAPQTSSPAVVTISQTPQYSVQPVGGTFCEGESLILQGQFSNNADNFQWWFNGNVVQFNATPTLTINSLTPQNQGNYVLVAFNSCGSTQSQTVSVTVNPLNNTSLQAEICAGDSYTIGGNTYNQSGTYTVSLTNTFGCDSLVQVNLNVLNPITGNIQAQLCGGSSFQFGSQNLTQTGTYTEVFQAVSGCDSTVTLQLNVIPQGIVFPVSETICSGSSYLFGNQTLAQAGVYSQNFTSIAGCDSTVELTLTVQNPINTTVTLNGNTLAAGQIGASYQWVDCNAGNTAISGATSINFTPTQSGTYAVIITAGNCSETSACVTVNLPGGLGIETNPDITLRVFPNPTGALLNIQVSEEMDEIRIYNSLGQWVQTYTLPGMSTTLDLSGLSNGVYYLKISGDLFSTTERIIISR